MIVTIIGSGNVATHIATRLYEQGVKIAGVYSRTLENAQTLASKVNCLATSDKHLIPDADIYIVSVKDDTITSVLEGASIRKDAILVHTAGSVSMDILAPFSSNIGVIYPMQTFSKAKDVDWTQIPLFIEANTSILKDNITQFASIISPKVTIATSAARKYIHIAAVFACNFTNELYAIADRLLAENGIDFSILYPLIDETVAKIKVMPPVCGQTGPAVRNDKKVLNSHYNMLKGTDLDIYKLISNAIEKEQENRK